MTARSPSLFRCARAGLPLPQPPRWSWLQSLMFGFFARSGGPWSNPAKDLCAGAPLATWGALFIRTSSSGCLVAKASVETAETFILGMAAITVVSCASRRN